LDRNDFVMINAAAGIKLVLDFQGTTCEWSRPANAYLVAGSWAPDEGASGIFHQATGIGNIDIIIPADPTVTEFGFFLDGNLHATP
jgi:hypothetical protein